MSVSLLLVFHLIQFFSGGAIGHGLANVADIRSSKSFPLRRPTTTVLRQVICDGSNGYTGFCSTLAQCNGLNRTPAGKCGSGPNVCCTISIKTCGGIAQANNTYWQNPGGYADPYTKTGKCSLTARRLNTQICQLRLDFFSLVLADPDQNPGTATQCLTDSFTVSGQTNLVPTICGINSEQHSLAADNSDVNLHITTIGFLVERFWDIRISQIPCGASYAAPDNCLQWFTETSGGFTSFNYQFLKAPLVQHLANQDYTICIRQNDGYCGVKYEVCQLDPLNYKSRTHFLLSAEMSQVALIDYACMSDYLQIPCATDQRSRSQLQSIGYGCSTKICGSVFSSILSATEPAPVYSELLK